MSLAARPSASPAAARPRLGVEGGESSAGVSRRGSSPSSTRRAAARRSRSSRGVTEGAEKKSSVPIVTTTVLMAFGVVRHCDSWRWQNARDEPQKSTTDFRPCDRGMWWHGRGREGGMRDVLTRRAGPALEGAVCVCVCVCVCAKVSFPDMLKLRGSTSLCPTAAANHVSKGPCPARGLPQSAILLLYVHRAANAPRLLPCDPIHGAPRHTHCMHVCPTAPHIPSHASLKGKRGSWGLGVRPQYMQKSAERKKATSWILDTRGGAWSSSYPPLRP